MPVQISVAEENALDYITFYEKLNQLQLGSMLTLTNPEVVSEMVPDIIDLMVTAMSVDESARWLQIIDAMPDETTKEPSEETLKEQTGSPWHSAVANVCAAILSLYTVTKEMPVS
jgi:hypothetical protein